MSEEGSLTARAWMSQSGPSALHVEGTVLAFSDDARVLVQEAAAPEFNPAFYAIDVVVEEGTGPKKGHFLDWSYRKEMELGEFEKVAVRSGEERIEIDILNDLKPEGGGATASDLLRGRGQTLQAAINDAHKKWQEQSQATLQRSLIVSIRRETGGFVGADDFVVEVRGEI
jgi:hypothetical protein